MSTRSATSYGCRTAVSLCDDPSTHLDEEVDAREQDLLRRRADEPRESEDEGPTRGDQGAERDVEQGDEDLDAKNKRDGENWFVRAAIRRQRTNLV